MSVSVIALVCLLLAAVVALMMLRRSRGVAGAKPLGIVLLLSRAKPLDLRALAELFERIIGKPFVVIEPQSGKAVTPADLPSSNAVLGGPNSFLVQAEGDLFVVNSVAKPYLEGSKRIDHQAWVSVEILHPQAVSAANYRIVGQAIAELMGPECVALFHPLSQKLVLANPTEVLTQLRSPHPIQAVFGLPFEQIS